MNIRTLLFSTLFAVLTAISALFIIPLPIVPISLQVAVVLLSGLMLGPYGGALSQAFYVLLGLIGLPVFAGGTGGIQTIFSPTFGFLVGFIFAAWISGVLSVYAKKAKKYRYAAYLAVCLAGVITMYVIALPLLYINLRYVANMDLSLVRLFQIGLLPFIIPDFVKALLAAVIAERYINVFRVFRGL